MKARTAENGYLDVKLGEFTKTAHFGMVFIKNLHNRDLTLSQIGDQMLNGLEIEKYVAMSEVLFAGFKAFDRTNGIDIDYNEDICLEWTMSLSEDQINEFQTALLHAVSLNAAMVEAGKKKRGKSPQKKT